jgi:hypothetical protein
MYRSVQTFNVFVGFVAFLLLQLISQSGVKYGRNIVVACLLFLAFRQAIYLHQIAALNNQRSDNEIAVVHQLGIRLKSEFEDKPVVFVGSYALGDNIQRQVSVNDSLWGYGLYDKLFEIFHESYPDKYVGSNVNSVLDWNEWAFGNQDMMKELFSYCGYDIEVMESYSSESYQEICEKAVQMNMRPFEIEDMGEYILVCLGQL